MGAYKGIWEAKKIANPEYEDDDSLYKFEDFGFIGFDLWQVKGGTIFDNIIITDDAAEADAFAKKWKELSEAEAAKKKEADAAKTDDDKKKDDEDDDDDADDEKRRRKTCERGESHCTALTLESPQRLQGGGTADDEHQAV